MFREEAQCFWVLCCVQVLWADAGYTCVSDLVVLTMKGAKYLHILFLFAATLYRGVAF